MKKAGRYRIDIAEHYWPPDEHPKSKFATYWVIHGNLGNFGTIMAEGETLNEAYENLSDALLATLASHEKGNKRNLKISRAK